MSFETWLNGRVIDTPSYRSCWYSAQAEMRELGLCGKPGHLKVNVQHGGPTGTLGKVECTICEEIRLERAAMLKMAAAHIPSTASDAHETWLICSCGMQSYGKGRTWKDWWKEHILALVPTSDASALDEAIRLAVEKALKAAMGARNEYPYRTPLSDTEMLGLEPPAGDTK